MKRSGWEAKLTHRILPTLHPWTLNPPQAVAESYQVKNRTICEHQSAVEKLNFCAVLNVPFEIEHMNCWENETDGIKAENCLWDKENMRREKTREEKESKLKHESRNKELKIGSCVLCRYLLQCTLNWISLSSSLHLRVSLFHFFLVLLEWLFFLHMQPNKRRCRWQNKAVGILKRVLCLGCHVKMLAFHRTYKVFLLWFCYTISSEINTFHD